MSWTLNGLQKSTAPKSRSWVCSTALNLLGSSLSKVMCFLSTGRPGPVYPAHAHPYPHRGFCSQPNDGLPAPLQP